ncbi:uncharacterized protein LOC143610648 [Bidens hawaiensis]|uniref:uncharacterized protein LOC143610648 n=1 Tax=Bidens hawaiensis TaxID=980011 RepID=UPI00404ADEC5
MDSPTSIYNRVFGPDQQAKDEAEEEAVTSAIVFATSYMSSVTEILKLYGPRYLREPNWNNLHRLYEAHTRVHGLPRMIGSVYCIHWECANWPTAWRGQYTRGDQKGSAVSFQAIASYDRSTFFGVPGSNNDITILEQSHVMESYISGTVPVALFWDNANFYHDGYYMGDGIYSEYAIIVKIFRDPLDEKRHENKNQNEGNNEDDDEDDDDDKDDEDDEGKDDEDDDDEDEDDEDEDGDEWFFLF